MSDPAWNPFNPPQIGQGDPNIPQNQGLGGVNPSQGQGMNISYDPAMLAQTQSGLSAGKPGDAMLAALDSATGGAIKKIASDPGKKDNSLFSAKNLSAALSALLAGQGGAANPAMLAKMTGVDEKGNTGGKTFIDSMIDAAGGPDVVKERLSTPSTRNVIGTIAGQVPLMMAGPESTMGQMAYQGAQGAAGSLISGEGNPIVSGATGAALGGLGAAAGKGIKSATALRRANPEEAINGPNGALNWASARWLATKLKMLPREIGDFYRFGLRHPGSDEEIVAAMGKDAQFIKDNNLASELEKNKFIKQFGDGGSEWKKVDEATSDAGYRVSNIENKIMDRPEVQNYIQMGKKYSNLKPDEDIASVLRSADNRDAKGNDLGALSFKNAKDILASQENTAWNIASTRAGSRTGQFADAPDDFLRARAAAIGAAKDEFQNNAAKLALQNNALSVMPDQLLYNYKISKLLDQNEAKKILGALSQGNKDIGSVTRFGVNPLHPMGLARNMAAYPLARATQNITSGARAGWNGIKMGILRSEGGNEMAQFLAKHAPGPNMPQALGQIGGGIGRGIAQPGSDNIPPVTPVGGPVQHNPPAGQNAQMGAPASQMATNPFMQYQQALQQNQGSYGKGGNDFLENMQPGAATPQIAGNVPKGTAAQKGATPVTSQAALMARNSSRGWASSPYDAAIERGLDVAAANKLKALQITNPAQAQEWSRRFKEGALQAIHSGVDANGMATVDPIMAARVMFPNNEAKQAQFAKAAMVDMTIQRAFQQGAAQGGGIFGVGGIANIKGMIPGYINQVNQAEEIKSKASEIGGQGLVSAVDNALRNPLINPQKKMQLIRNAFATHDPQSWNVYLQALGGQ